MECGERDQEKRCDAREYARLTGEIESLDMFIEDSRGKMERFRRDRKRIEERVLEKAKYEVGDKVRLIHSTKLGVKEIRILGRTVALHEGALWIIYRGSTSNEGKHTGKRFVANWFEEGEIEAVIEEHP